MGEGKAELNASDRTFDLQKRRGWQKKKSNLLYSIRAYLHLRSLMFGGDQKSTIENKSIRNGFPPNDL